MIMIWFNNVRSNHTCVNNVLIEKAKNFRGELNITGFLHFVEKIFCFDKFDNPEKLIIRIFSREPKGLDYRDNCIVPGIR